MGWLLLTVPGRKFRELSPCDHRANPENYRPYSQPTQSTTPSHKLSSVEALAATLSNNGFQGKRNPVAWLVQMGRDLSDTKRSTTSSIFLGDTPTEMSEAEANSSKSP